MLRPNNTKYRKSNKGRNNVKVELKANQLKFGMYGLQALEKGDITARQIEAVRRTITGFTKRTTKIWIRIFPDLPITRKPTEVRMGKGKGNVSHWVARVKPGRILYEVSGGNIKLLKDALKLATNKLPIHVKIIKRKNI